MKKRLKNILILVVLFLSVGLGIQSIIKGSQESEKYFERDDKYVTIDAKVKSVHRHGLGYTVETEYEYGGMSSSAYIEKAFGIAPEEGDLIQIEVDSVYPVRIRPASNGVFKIVLGSILIVAAIGLFVFWKKIKIGSKMKKVIKIAATVVLVWILSNGIIILITAFKDSRDADWGLKMSVTKVTPKKIVVHLEREDLEHMESLTYGSNWVLEKRTAFGWKTLYPIHGYVSTAIGYELRNIDSTYLDIDFEGWFGELPPGVYRIYKDMFVDDLYSYPEEEREALRQELYATFVVLW